MAKERYQVRKRENSKFFPFAVVDTADHYRAVRLATTKHDADEAAELLNGLEEYHPDAAA